MPLSMFAIPLLCAACLAQLDGPSASDEIPRPVAAAPIRTGRVLESNKKGLTISVEPGEEPALGAKVEVYIQIPGQDGIAILAVGQVVEVDEGLVTATLNSKTGRINKDQMVRFLAPAGNDEVRQPMKPELTATPAIIPSKIPHPDFPDGLPDSGSNSGPGNRSGPLDKSGPIGPPGKARGPMKSSDAPIDFSQAVANYKRALLILGDPQAGRSGTGFVISKSRRLVATNAHVADIAKMAVLNESRTSYKVIRRWYHPGVIRVMDDGITRVQSIDPQDGTVYPECADIAILQLEPGGPELPTEVVLASPIDAQEIVGSSVGMLGYPGYQFDQRIRGEVYASSTFVQGTISRMTGLNHTPEVPPELRQLVNFSANNYKGFSGGPVFLRDGQIVVINNHFHGHDGHTEGSDLAYGIRVDALWELIDREGMTKFVSGDPAGFIRHGSFDLPVDPQVQKLRESMKLMAESIEHMRHDDFDDARRHLDDAILLSPKYWRLYSQASKNIHHYVTEEWDELSASQKLPHVKASLKALQTALSLYQDAYDRPNVRLVLDVAREMISIGRLNKDVAIYKQALELLDKYAKNVGEDRDYYLALRGSVKTDINDLPGALEDLTEAIRLSPNSKDFYNSRSYVWSKLGQRQKAADDKKKYKQIFASEHHGEHAHEHNHGGHGHKH